MMFCRSFSSGKLGSSSCFWVEWRLPMCFPSTLQLERSISLCGVTLANSPALDHNTAEQNGGRRKNSARRERLQCNRTGQEGEDQTETGRERRRQDGPEQEKTDEWSRDALGHDKISIRADTGMLYIGYISPYLICCWILTFIIFILKCWISLHLNPNSQHCKQENCSVGHRRDWNSVQMSLDYVKNVNLTILQRKTVHKDVVNTSFKRIDYNGTVDFAYAT